MTDLERAAIIEEGIRLAESVRRTERPEFFLAAARERVENEAAFIAAYDDAMDGLNAKERQALATKLRQEMGNGFGPTAIKRMKVRLANPEEYIQSKAFDFCSVMNELAA